MILWQAKRVLDTILTQTPFLRANAGALKRAAVCCWVISGAALVRLVLWLWSEGNVRPLFTYTALFIPAFFMGGLLFLVMSALFRQAAELARAEEARLLVLDEVIDALRGFLPQEELCAFLDERPAGLEVVLTGHSLPEALERRADYITHMVKEKHPYDRGVTARREIEF